MNRHSLCAAALMWAAAGTSGALAQDGDGYGTGDRSRSEAYPASIVQTGYGIDLEDDAERYSSGIERWCLDIRDCVRRTQLRGYKRLQRMHRKLLYPECPPYYSPTFGHHHTQWRPYPENCEYVWSGVPETPVWPMPAAAPGMLPLTPVPAPASELTPQPAPAAELPYFPEVQPQIQPDEPSAPPPPAAEPPGDPQAGNLQPYRVPIESTAADLPVVLQIE